MDPELKVALSQAVAEQKNGNFKKAESLYRGILKKNPNVAAANHNLGLLAMCLNKPSASLKYFEKATEKGSKNQQFLLSHINALINVRQFEKAQKKLLVAKQNQLPVDVFHEVQEKILSARKKNEPSIEALSTLVSFFKSKQNLEAEKLAKSLILSHPKHVLAWEILAALFGGSGRLKEALPYFEKVVLLKPNDPDAINNLGITLQKMGKFNEAATQLRVALDLKPEFAEAANNLGITFEKLGDLPQARLWLEKATLLNQNNADFQNNLAGVLRESGNLDLAKITHERAIALAPTNGVFHTNYGVTLKKLQLTTEARTAYLNALKFSPELSELHYNLGVLLLSFGDLIGAEKSHQTAISLNPQNLGARKELGVVLRESGRTSEAILCFKQIIKIRPTYAEAHHGLGVLLYFNRKYEEAAIHFKQSDSSLSKSFLLRCYFDLGHLQRFEELLDKIIAKGNADAMVGSLTLRANDLHGWTKKNIFVDKPFDFVTQDDLGKYCNFKKLFIEGSSKIFSSQAFAFKDQRLLKNGRQTSGNLFSRNEPQVQSMKDIIIDGIERYRKKFSKSDSSLIRNWPQDYYIYSWLVQMNEGGELAPHIHEAGWISGAVYINVPRKLNPDEGNFVVCTHEDKSLNVGGENTKIVDVFTGSLVLFPSSLMHYTFPFTSAEERIVLAFDVMPR